VNVANWEIQLCSRVIRTGCLTDVLEQGITPEDFVTSEGRGMFNHLVGYYSQANTAGAIIGVHGAKQVYPNFELCDDESMTTPALCAEVRRQRITLELKSRLSRAIEMADADPMGAASEAQHIATDALTLGVGKSTDVHFTSALDNILTRYELIESGADLSIGTWPWLPLQEATGGIQPDDYVVLYGRPKSFKSWVLAALIAHVYENNKRAIIYTKEMSAENIFMRVAATISQIEYHGFRRGKLAAEHKAQVYALRRMLAATNQSERLIALSGQDLPEGGDTVPWLRSKIEHYKPDLVFIDGMYLMSDVKRAKKDHERVMHISRDLRQIVLALKAPIICTLQATRKSSGHEEANLDELAYSDAIGQDATLVMRVINEKTGPTVALVVGGAREFDLNGFRINAIPATDFSFHSYLTEKEILNAKEADAKAEGENPEAHVKQRKKKARTEKQALKAAEARLDKLF